MRSMRSQNYTFIKTQDNVIFVSNTDSLYVYKSFSPPEAFYFAPVLKDPELTCFSRHKGQVGTLTGT